MDTPSAKGNQEILRHTQECAHKPLYSTRFNPHTLPLVHTQSSFPKLTVLHIKEVVVCMLVLLVHTHSFPSLEGELQALEAGAVFGCMCVLVLGALPELSLSSVQAVPMARTTRPDSPSRSKHCK